jgi:outer membrane lipoprotein-sorting protein
MKIEKASLRNALGGTGLRPVVSGVAPETGRTATIAPAASVHPQRTSSDEIRHDAGFDRRDACATHFSLRLKHFLALLILFAAVSVFAGTSADLPPALQELQKKMTSVKTIYLEFTQERELKLFSEPLKSSGVMLIEQPDRIRWETTAPYQSLLLGDQKSVAQFEFNDGKWEKLKLGFPQLLQRVMQQMSAMNRGDFGAMLSDYTLAVSTNTDIVLTFTPKDATVRGMMSTMEIHVPPDLSTTHEVVMNEPNGDLTRITFTRAKYDLTFPPGTFDLIKPLAIADVQAAVNHAP